VPIAGLPEPEADGRRASRRLAPIAPVEPIAIRPDEAPPAGPTSLSRRIDVDLARAPIAEALRLLADAAEFDVVVGDDVIDEVTMRLRQVRVRDALDAIAATHGLEMEWRGRVLLVRAAHR